MITDGTIAAISSAVGAAGRMIVRVSGAEALRIAREIADPLPGAGAAQLSLLRFNQLETRGWVYLFAERRSYTGEDLVEFHIAGNPLMARMLLESIIARGARLAEPGEFTARAYFNGKLDLAEAEGVAATIAASNERELRAARQLAGGELSRRLRPMMDSLAEALALVEVGIDFSDEDVTFLSADALETRIDEIDGALAELMDRSVRFERLTHEPTFVLVGRPNAGKSTLLNALAGHDRAIVSPVAGTTRDALSADVRLERGIVRVIDVAGLDRAVAEPSLDSIERQMGERAIAAVNAADHVILLRDITDPLPSAAIDREPDLVLYNKIDLQPRAPRDGLAISAAAGTNLDQLRERLDAIAFGASSPGNSPLALNARHRSAISDARAALTRAREICRSAGAELVALELRESLDSLGQVLGQVSPDDVLGRVFSNFCIGK